MAVFLLCPHFIFLFLLSNTHGVPSMFYEGAGPIGSVSHPLTSFHLSWNNLLRFFLQIQSHWGLGLQHMNLGGHNSVHSIPCIFQILKFISLWVLLLRTTLIYQFWLSHWPLSMEFPPFLCTTIVSWQWTISDLSVLSWLSTHSINFSFLPLYFFLLS